MTKEEFKHLILPSKEKLFRTAMHLLRDRYEAEDTLQEAMLKLWTIRNRLAEHHSVEALAVTMTKNLCVDKLRSYRHRMQNNTEVDKLNLVSETVSPEAELELNEDLQRVHRMVEDLPEQQQLIFIMREFRQFSYEEIQEATGMTVNGVRVALFRARQKIRNELLKHHNDVNVKR
jgi:RNA polymerase sigma-70 factor (ECF subfamily)